MLTDCEYKQQQLQSVTVGDKVTIFWTAVSSLNGIVRAWIELKLIK
jgi:hypothetical protein